MFFPRLENKTNRHKAIFLHTFQTIFITIVSILDFNAVILEVIIKLTDGNDIVFGAMNDRTSVFFCLGGKL